MYYSLQDSYLVCQDIISNSDNPVGHSIILEDQLFMDDGVHRKISKP